LEIKSVEHLILAFKSLFFRYPVLRYVMRFFDARMSKEISNVEVHDVTSLSKKHPIPFIATYDF